MSRYKRSLNHEIYKKLLKYTCAHPECTSGYDIEVHHIRPLSKGGEDAYWNVISLCYKCHRRKGLHSKSDEVLCELYTYKSMHELAKVGFFFDEDEDGFKGKLKKATKECSQ